MSGHLLLVDDHEAFLRSLGKFLERSGFSVLLATCAEQALELASQYPIDLAVTDLVLPGIDGLELLSELITRHGMPVILMTGHSQTDVAKEAVRRGAYEFLVKPVIPDQLVVHIRNALDHRRLELRSYPPAPLGFGGLLGKSEVMQEVFRRIEKVAPRDTPVLLTGETGTGKNLVAREIHTRSPRVSGPFLQINCAALPEELFESELFGHERGAFTGAGRRHAGRFERARDGTLLLDEIDCLPLQLQAKLLRVLEEREYERVGGQETLRSNVRILAATNHDLAALVAEGRFRQDLFYRLATFLIELPPLRERPEDIPLLVQRFLNEQAEKQGRDLPGITPEVMEEAGSHSWPGNVRELANAVAHGLIRCEGEFLSSLLPPATFLLPDPPPEQAEGKREVPNGETSVASSGDHEKLLEKLYALPFGEATESFQRAYLARTLEQNRTLDRKELARLLGLHPRTLSRTLKRLGLD